MRQNPFDHQNPTDPAVFMDREAERARLSGLIQEHQNVLLYGPRRRGKTSLILRVLADLEDHTPIYADAMRMKHPGDLGDRILASLAGSGFAKRKRFTKWVQDRLARLELEATLSERGMTLSVRRGADHQTGLLHALEFLERIAEAADTHIVVCLDEFQIVMDHDPGLVGAIRSIVQHQRHVSYIFSGSAPTVLARLNHEKASPFYQQLTEMRIQGISIHDMRSDAERLLGTPLDDDAVARLHATTGGNTKRTIQVLGRLFEQQQGGDLVAVENALQATLDQNTSEYERILSLVRPGLQRMLLIALAEDQPEQVTATAFITKHGLGSGAHVHRGLQALRRLEIIDEDHRFLDGVFRRYLLQ